MIVKEYVTSHGTKVKVTCPSPGEVPEYIRQGRIDRLYDLLKPKTTKKED